MSEANALHSLYGGKTARKALSGMVGGQAREQTVLTPDWLLDAIRAVAPIGLDPCTTPENPVGASVFMAAPNQDGLAWDWSDCLGFPTWEAHNPGIVYVNPPYADLKTWMRKCALEATGGDLGIYLLAPFRPQRKWFIEYTRGYGVVSLTPFAFKGHKQAFPAPVCLVCYNLPVPNLGKYETGRWTVA